MTCRQKLETFGKSCVFFSRAVISLMITPRIRAPSFRPDDNDGKNFYPEGNNCWCCCVGGGCSVRVWRQRDINENDGNFSDDGGGMTKHPRGLFRVPRLAHWRSYCSNLLMKLCNIILPLFGVCRGGEMVGENSNRKVRGCRDLIMDLQKIVSRDSSFLNWISFFFADIEPTTLQL